MPDAPAIDWDFSLEHTNYGRILLRTMERVKALALPCIERYAIRKQGWMDDDLQPPYCMIYPRDDIRDWTKGTNEQDDIVYAVMLSFVLANSRDNTLRGLGLQLNWLEKSARSFHNKSPATWPDLILENGAFIHCYVESGQKFIEPAKRMQYDAHSLLIRYMVREARE